MDQTPNQNLIVSQPQPAINPNPIPESVLPKRGPGVLMIILVLLFLFAAGALGFWYYTNLITQPIPQPSPYVQASLSPSIMPQVSPQALPQNSPSLEPSITQSGKDTTIDNWLTYNLVLDGKTIYTLKHPKNMEEKPGEPLTHLRLVKDANNSLEVIPGYPGKGLKAIDWANRERSDTQKDNPNLQVTEIEKVTIKSYEGYMFKVSSSDWFDEQFFFNLPNDPENCINLVKFVNHKNSPPDAELDQIGTQVINSLTF